MLYTEVALKLFRLDKKFLSGFTKLCQKMSPVLPLISIHKKNGDPVGLGGIVKVGNKGFLHSGCIVPAWRSKGLSKNLIQISRDVGKAYGMEVYSCTTRNSRVSSQTDKLQEFSLLSKIT